VLAPLLVTLRQAATNNDAEAIKKILVQWVQGYAPAGQQE
jgi:hypothetical protein